MAAGEDDPFSDFLSQDQSAGEVPVPVAAPAAAGETDAAMMLRLLVESSQRQEQLLGKVCSLLVGMDDKIGRLAANQERLEATLQTSVSQAMQGSSVAAGGNKAASATPSHSRGSIVVPPGKSGAGIVPSNAPLTPAQAAEEQRLNAERLAQDRIRIEEEGRRRAEELARKRDEDERRRREEAERQRIEEEKRREEERQRKMQFEKKTNGLMSNLITNSGGGGLFGDEVESKPKKGGLFDDD